jgi:hypothetical protein
VGQRFTANEFMIPPEYWGDSLPPANQSWQLDAFITDADGLVIKRAAPVRFHMRHATIYNRPRPPFPPAHAKPPLPRVKPEPEPMISVMPKRSER